MNIALFQNILGFIWFFAIYSANSQPPYWGERIPYKDSSTFTKFTTIGNPDNLGNYIKYSSHEGRKVINDIFYFKSYDSFSHTYYNYSYYTNDTIKFVNNYIIRDTMLLQNGKSYIYHNSNLFEEAEFRLGLLTGPFRIYHDNRKIWHYNYYKNGLREGKCFEYYESGLTKVIENYQSGKLHGRYYEYYSNGKIKIKGYYINGEKVRIWKTYNESGKILTKEKH